MSPYREKTDLPEHYHSWRARREQYETSNDEYRYINTRFVVACRSCGQKAPFWVYHLVGLFGETGYLRIVWTAKLYWWKVRATLKRDE